MLGAKYMPVYEFARKREGTNEVVSANLSFRELEVYNLLIRALGKKASLKEVEAADDKESSLYGIITREAAGAADGKDAEKRENAGRGEALSWDEFKTAYEKLERSSVIEEAEGRLKILPRKYSSTPVIFNGPGFYSTDNSKGSGRDGNGNGNNNHNSNNIDNKNSNGKGSRK
jgi:predicted nucleic acid-binding Zn ribbon protein